MLCGYAVEICCSLLLQDALTATISTTLRWIAIESLSSWDAPSAIKSNTTYLPKLCNSKASYLGTSFALSSGKKSSKSFKYSSGWTVPILPNALGPTTVCGSTPI